MLTSETQTLTQTKMTEIVEVYGNSFTGKTLYALSLLDKNKASLYIDVDCKLQDNLNYPENMFIFRNNDIDNICELVTRTISDLDTIVIDSLPNVTSDKNINNLQYDFSIFKKIREIIALCKDNDVDLIIVNQMRYHKGSKRKSFRLRALGLYYTKRIYIDDNGNPKITKNLH